MFIIIFSLLQSLKYNLALYGNRNLIRSNFRKISIIQQTPSLEMIGKLEGEGEFEHSVGIRTYLSQHSGIRGILKQRYTDFIVREVDTNGNVVYLKEFDNAKEFESISFKSSVTDDVMRSNKVSTENNSATIISKFLLELQLIECLDLLISKQELCDFLDKSLSKSDDCPSQIIGFSCSNKKSRTEFHNTVKKHLGLYIDTSTEVADVSVLDNASTQKNSANAAAGLSILSHIKLQSKHMKNKGGKGNIKRDRDSNQWPSGLGHYLQFTLLKENIDSMGAIQQIARNLRIKDASIGYAGTKDKRAVRKVKIYERCPYLS